jgi:hypothetical protein
LILNVKLDEIGIRLKTQILHDAIFVKRNVPRRYSQDIRRLLHGFSLCKKLEDFSPTWCKRFPVAPAVWIANEGFLHPPGNLWCDEGFASKRGLNSLKHL